MIINNEIIEELKNMKLLNKKFTYKDIIGFGVKILVN